MKKFITILMILSSFGLLQGCMTYQDSAASSWNGHSQAGTPVKTRLCGSDSGFRFLFIGSSPSDKIAMDNLYKSAEESGFKIEGNNYSFQNMRQEYSGVLYPFLGYGYLTVSADLYKYDYKGTEYSIKENNSSISSNTSVFSIFQNLF